MLYSNILKRCKYYTFITIQIFFSGAFVLERIVTFSSFLVKAFSWHNVSLRSSTELWPYTSDVIVIDRKCWKSVYIPHCENDDENLLPTECFYCNFSSNPPYCWQRKKARMKIARSKKRKKTSFFDSKLLEKISAKEITKRKETRRAKKIFFIVNK